jgi:glutamate dehydrogenase (NAD(P)+)
MSVIAVADVQGAVVNDGGLDPVALAAHVQRTGAVTELAEAQSVTGEAIFDLDYDIFIPAALGASSPRMSLADCAPASWSKRPTGQRPEPAPRSSSDRGVVVVPDVLANAGGVVASYFEWAQDLQGFLWERDLFQQRHEQTMRQAFDDVWRRSEELSVPLREAALATGVGRIAEATELRGLFP